MLSCEGFELKQLVENLLDRPSSYSFNEDVLLSDPQNFEFLNQIRDNDYQIQLMFNLLSISIVPFTALCDLDKNPLDTNRTDLFSSLLMQNPAQQWNEAALMVQHA